MGTITSRRRKDGTEGHTAQIRIKANGRIIHSETQTFDRLAAANLWIKKREAELAKPGALDAIRSSNPPLADVIAQYMRESKRALGKTKEQVLRTIARSDLGQMRCADIHSKHIIAFAQALNVQPQTVGNYLSHLAAVMTVARPAWGHPLDVQAVQDARVVAKKLGISGRSRNRERRPSLAELERLLNHFATTATRRSNTVPMCQIVLFALFGTRRQDEITRLAVADIDLDGAEAIVRDMKNPGDKLGNDTRVTLPPEALEIARHRLATHPGSPLLFGGHPDTISTAFTRACLVLGIEDLHFHDLRHDGISRLFEIGWSIPKVATVSGHRTWSSLKRYTHIRQDGDKYAGWEWRRWL